jgi:hypothetical protein
MIDGAISGGSVLSASNGLIIEFQFSLFSVLTAQALFHTSYSFLGFAYPSPTSPPSGFLRPQGRKRPEAGKGFPGAQNDENKIGTYCRNVNAQHTR